MDDPAVVVSAALNVPGMGSGHLRAMHEVYGSVAAALAGARAGHAPPGGVPARVFARLPGALDLRAAAGRLRQARSAGVEVLCWDDARYPAPLWLSPEAPPALLYVRGALPATFGRPAARVRAAAVVGTRRATARGLRLAHELAAALAELRVVVVSGLAIGIDGAAHEGALDGGGATVAVLGAGHAHLHPPRHRGLAQRILAAGGALLSEHPPDVRPEAHYFPQRNRLISGLSRLVVVVEAGIRSGAHSTARHAQAQHRDVFACPGRPGDPTVAGTLRLIRDGAHPVTELEDVLWRFRAEPGDPGLRGRLTLGTEGEHAAASEGAPGDRALLSALYAVEEASLDDLAAMVGAGVAELTARLTRLELRGEVCGSDAGRYRLASEARQRRADRDHAESERREALAEAREEASRRDPTGAAKPNG